jgi:hypothetical protein
VNTFIKSALLAGVTVLLAGCWESPEITVAEPGKYKGKSDPLMQQQATARGDTLKKRFQLVQTDR